MNRDNVEKTVIAIISDACCCTKEVVVERIDSEPLDYFVDSLWGFEILCEIENQLHITIEETELEKLGTINDLVDFICQNKHS